MSVALDLSCYHIDFNKDDIFNIMKKSSHAKRLSSNDNLIDIKFCSQIDKYDLIPYLDNDRLKLL